MVALAGPPCQQAARSAAAAGAARRAKSTGAGTQDWRCSACWGADLVPGLAFRALIEECTDNPFHALTAFGAIVGKLDERQALEVLRTLPWHRLRSAAIESRALLEGLALRLGSHVSLLIETIPRICSPRHAAGLLCDLAPAIDDPSQAGALAAALQLRSDGWRAEALMGIVGRLGPTEQERVIAALLETPRDSGGSGASRRSDRSCPVQPSTVARRRQVHPRSGGANDAAYAMTGDRPHHRQETAGMRTAARWRCG